MMPLKIKNHHLPPVPNKNLSCKSFPLPPLTFNLSDVVGQVAVVKKYKKLKNDLS